MAVVTRYFSTTGAGAADGTSWAARAALFSAGSWSTVISGFNFAGSDSLKVLIGPGTYTCSQGLSNSIFANPPIVANPIILTACDSSGVQLEPPNPDWTSDTAVDWDSNLPVIATTSNIPTLNQAATISRLIKFTATATSNPPWLVAAMIEWCVLEHNGSNANAYGFDVTVARIANCYINMAGSSYACGGYWTTNNLLNLRIKGNAGAGGNRAGIEESGSNSPGAFVGNTIFGHGGDGINSTMTGAGHAVNIQRSVIANNAGAGFEANSTALQTAFHVVRQCMLTGNGTYGINAQSQARVIALDNRLRDNATADFNGFGNFPTDLSNYTTDSDDATEYVDATNGDFRIKNTAAIWGFGYGVSDQAAAAVGGGTTIAGTPFRRGMV